MSFGLFLILKMAKPNRKNKYMRNRAILRKAMSICYCVLLILINAKLVIQVLEQQQYGLDINCIILWCINEVSVIFSNYNDHNCTDFKCMNDVY